MNPQHLLIDNACRIEVLAEYNHFNDDQKKELLDILDKFRDSTHKFMLFWRLKKFEDTFKKYGGNYTIFEKRIKEVSAAPYIKVAESLGLKITKKEEILDREESFYDE